MVKNNMKSYFDSTCILIVNSLYLKNDVNDFKYRKHNGNNVMPYVLFLEGILDYIHNFGRILDYKHNFGQWTLK